MTNNRLLCVFFMLFLSFQALKAQEEDVLRPHGKALTEEEKSKFTWMNHPEKKPFMIGLEAGVNYNMFDQTMDRNLTITPSVNDVLQKGYGVSPFFGLLFEGTITSQVALQLKLMYDMKSYTNTADGIVDSRYQTGGVYQAPMTAEYKASVAYLSIVPTLRYSVDPHFFLTVGANIALQMGDHKRDDKITVGSADTTTRWYINYQLQSDTARSISRTVVQATDMLPPVDQSQLLQESSKFVDYNKTRVGIELGAGYLTELSSNTALAIQVRYQYMFTVLNEDFVVNDWSRTLSNENSTVTYKSPMLHSLQLSLGLWFKVM